MAMIPLIVGLVSFVIFPGKPSNQALNVITEVPLQASLVKLYTVGDAYTTPYFITSEGVESLNEYPVDPLLYTMSVLSDVLCHSVVIL